MGNRFSLLRRRDPVPEQLTRPQRLVRPQPTNADCRKLRRLILARKLAPCYNALDDPDVDLEECPICFYYFPTLNRSRCCSKGICTECFLQTKRLHCIARSAQCPFCKSLPYTVKYHGARTKKEKILEQMEEQKVIEAQIRMQRQDPYLSDHITPSTGAHHPIELHTTTTATTFITTETTTAAAAGEPLPTRSSSTPLGLHMPNKCYGPPNVISKDFEFALAEGEQSDHNSSGITGIPREHDLHAEPKMFVLTEHIRQFLEVLTLFLFTFICARIFFLPATLRIYW